MFKQTKSRKYKSRRRRRAKKHTLFVSYADIKKEGFSFSLPTFSVMKKAFFIFTVLFLILPATRLLAESTMDFFTENTFDLKNIKIANNLIYSQEEILKIAGVEKKGSVFDVNIYQVRDKIESDANIAQAVVVRIVPDTISIKVYEKMPLMVVKDEQKQYFVDKNGEILSWDKSRIKSILPVVDGIKVKEYGEKHEILKTVFSIYDAYNHFTTLKEELGFEKFQVDNRYRIEMEIADGRKLLLGDSVDFNKAFNRLNRVYADIKEKGKVFSTVDLRFKDVVVKGMK